MGEEADIKAAIGATLASNGLSNSAKTTLMERLFHQPDIAIPDFSSEISHEKYMQLRMDLKVSTTLAALADAEQLGEIGDKWIQLQTGYARQVISQVTQGKTSQEAKLARLESEIEAGEKTRTELAEIGRLTAAELDDQGIEKLLDLRSAVEKLDKKVEEANGISQAIAGISRVEQTLTTLIENPVESINYIIPSAEDIQQRLAENRYNGPDFDPFSVSPKVSPKDIFVRNGVAPVIRRVQRSNKGKGYNIDLNDMPQILQDLLKLYDHVLEQAPGTKMVAARVREELGFEKLGQQTTGAYIEDHMGIFGVTKVESANSRTFIRAETGVCLDREAFVNLIVDNLKQQDKPEVRGFYLGKTLHLLRERPEAYTGFTKEEVQALAENARFPLNSRYIARRLNADLESLGIEAKTKEDETVLIFSEVIPTERQMTYIPQAVETFGANPFTARDIVAKVHELEPEYNMSLRVTEFVLDRDYATKGDTGYRITTRKPEITYKKRAAKKGGKNAADAPREFI
ncbi:MAG: hypothetical protein ABIH92_03395 [Nanoarchaeota archaeon]